RITDERKDERRRLASELHDDLLPEVFHLSLVAQVLRRDLERGRHDDLGDDALTIVAASEQAARHVRELIGGLRRSPVGSRGLMPSLDRVAKELQDQSAVPIEVIGEQLDVADDLQLIIYQVTREALA